MEGVQCLQPLPLKRKGQSLYPIGDLQTLRSESQDGKNLSAPRLIWNTPHFVFKRL